MLELKKIKKSYMIGKDHFTVLNGVDLSIKEWEYIAIMWPSGSGKSTLMNIIWMLDTLDEWEYHIDGVATHTLKESKRWLLRRQNIWFIFQNYSLISRIKIIEQVKLPLLYQWVSNPKATKIAQEALEKVWLGNKSHSLPNELSGWQKQRVAIARALVISPKIMLADEPTGALDTKTSQEIMDLFEQLHKEGKTIIIVTHEPEIAERTQRTIVVRDWNIIKS